MVDSKSALKLFIFVLIMLVSIILIQSLINLSRKQKMDLYIVGVGEIKDSGKEIQDADREVKKLLNEYLLSIKDELRAIKHSMKKQGTLDNIATIQAIVKNCKKEFGESLEYLKMLYFKNVLFDDQIMQNMKVHLQDFNDLGLQLIDLHNKLKEQQKESNKMQEICKQIFDTYSDIQQVHEQTKQCLELLINENLPE